jgi:hypothetical protein
MLIGVIGFIGSGKGTVGDYLIEKKGWRHDAFAAPLKDAVSIIFGWDRKLLEGDTDISRAWREEIDKKWSKVVGFDLSPRYALQLFGTECIRQNFSADVWSYSLVQRYWEAGLDTVATDCRFKNEIKAIKDANGYVIRVKRGDEPDWYDEYVYLMEKDDWHQIGKMRESGAFPHMSETDWIGSEFDAVIENNGTIEDLWRKTDNVITDFSVRSMVDDLEGN